MAYLATLNGLGLGPDDPCYDPNHPWYVPNFWNTAPECACIAADTTRPCGDQCVGYGPPGCSVASTMGNQAATVASAVTAPVGAVASGTLSGSVTGLLSGIGGGNPMVGGLIVVGGLLLLVSVLGARR